MCHQNFNSLVKMKQALLLISIAYFTPLSHAAFYECTNKAGETIFKDSECDDSETLNQRIDPESLSKKHSVFSPVVDDSNPLGKNLVLNADFEDQLIDWVVPLGALWSSNGGIRNSGGLIIHADKPPEDKYIHETVVSQCVVLNGGSKFGLSAQFKSLNRACCSVLLERSEKQSMGITLITLNQLSDECGISPRELSEAIRNGELIAERVGGRWVSVQ